MGTRWHFGLTAVVLVCAMMLLSAAAPEQPDITGTYTCRGTNPDSTPYAGSVEISKNGDAYVLKWSFGHSGTGLFSNGQLSASWGVKGHEYGIVVYKLEDNGQLTGKWFNAGGGKPGTEDLTRR